MQPSPGRAATSLPKPEIPFYIPKSEKDPSVLVEVAILLHSSTHLGYDVKPPGCFHISDAFLAMPKATSLDTSTSLSGA